MCFTLRLHTSAAPSQGGLTQALAAMDNSRVDELGNGIRVLDFDVSAELLALCGLPASVLEQIATMSVEAREVAGNALDVAAESVAAAFLSRKVGYWDADAVVTALMAAADWHGPMKFWRVFLAFEDSETAPEPDEPAIQKLAVALAGNGS